jgi:diaminopimelate epimerase
MGKASFETRDISLSGAPRLAVDEPLNIEGQEIHICAVSMGNPHCVVLDAAATAETAHRLGPLIESHPLFPRRTNVQFLEVLDRRNLRIEIWERGAGYTLASGSSSCAAAAAAYQMGWCENKVTVHMPGGDLQVAIAQDWEITLSGPVSYVFCGEIEEPSC